MSGVFVVTGATRGVGLKCAEHLLRASRRVVVASRDGKAVERTVNDLSAYGDVKGEVLDLASFASVRSFCDKLLETKTRISGLVCNAGVMMSEYVKAEKGMESTFVINHVGHFLLVKKVMPLLEENASIVIVSSALHASTGNGIFPAPTFGDPKEVAYVSEEDFDGRGAYTRSKLCNVLYGYELHRVLAKEGNANIRITVSSPGFVPETGLARGMGPVGYFFFSTFMPWIVRNNPEAVSVDESGKIIADRVLNPLPLQEVGDEMLCPYASVNGQTRSSEESYDKDKARLLWEYTEKIITEE